jgi:hypothetical protein
MRNWTISRSWPIEPPTGPAYDAAYIVRLTDGLGATRDMVVEFEAPSAVASVGYAEEISRRFRDRLELPEHVIVDVQRAVRVVGEIPDERTER